MIRHIAALITSWIRALTLDRLLSASLVAMAAFGALWVLYVIVSATVYPSREPVADIAATTLEGFEFATGPQPGPRARFVDGTGREITLANKAGKVILLNLWATWCSPCVRELPTLDRLQAELGSDRFEVVALNMDREGLEVIEPFYTEHGIEHLAPYNDAKFAMPREIKVAGLPATLLISARGLQIGRLIGTAEWDSPEAKALIERYIGR